MKRIIYLSVIILFALIFFSMQLCQFLFGEAPEVFISSATVVSNKLIVSGSVKDINNDAKEVWVWLKEYPDIKAVDTTILSNSFSVELDLSTLTQGSYYVYAQGYDASNNQGNKYSKVFSLNWPYTVTFYLDLTNILISYNVPKDSLIQAPNDPSKNGWIFTGWYKDSSFTEEWNFNVDKVNENISLYAKWINWTNIVSSYDAIPRDCVIDNSGNVYVVGHAQTSFDGQSTIGIIDAFVIKYDPQGNILWKTQIGVYTYETFGFSITLDNSGYCYITGETSGQLPGAIHPSEGTRSCFVSKINTSNGNVIISRIYDANTYGRKIKFYVDKLYLSGITDNNNPFGHAKIGDYDLFLVRIDELNSLDIAFSKNWGATASTVNVNDMAIDNTESIYIVGSTTGNILTQTAFSPNHQEGYIMKLLPDFTIQWYYDFGSETLNKITTCNSILIDGYDIYLTGGTDDSLNGVIITGDSDSFLIKYDTTGTYYWTRLLGVIGSRTSGMSIACDNYSIYLLGSTGGNLDGQLLNGLTNLFLSKYDKSGNLISTILNGTGYSYETIGYKINIFDNGTLILLGETEGDLNGVSNSGVESYFIYTCE